MEVSLLSKQSFTSSPCFLYSTSPVPLALPGLPQPRAYLFRLHFQPQVGRYLSDYSGPWEDIMGT